MSRPTKTLLGAKAKHAVLEGVNLIYETAGRTLGPEGKNALLYHSYNRGPRITNDGKAIRIQNYRIDTDQLRLFSGEYYLEVSVFPSWECGRENTSEVSLGGDVIGYKTNSGRDEGEGGGPGLSLCVEKPIGLFMHVTESNESVVLASQILSTFKFTK